MGPGCRADPNITKALGGNQATDLIRLLNIFTSSDKSLCIGHEPVTPSPLHVIHLLTMIVPVCLALHGSWCWGGPCVLLGASGSPALTFLKEEKGCSLAGKGLT